MGARDAHIKEGAPAANWLVTFHSISMALWFERVMLAAGFGCHVVPVPRQLSASCGYAAEVAGSNAAQMTARMQGEGIEWENIYAVEQREGQPVYWQATV